MSTLIQGNEVRALMLGRGPVSTATGTLDEDVTPTLFTVAGGEVLITALWAKVTTAITVANTVTIQANPTTGDTAAIVAGDLGTTDTAAGTVLGWEPDSAAFTRNGPPASAVVSTGTVEIDSNGTNVDGAMTVYCTWVPLTNGATLVAG
ncbi:hypothetical protein [Streptomyces viridochromogenes]|jgi:hypothetical protein|uniref:hypothetical protein n=1 Tax=Streptomyces viridochromogenes TaxID=1938 RepID=UPI00069DFB02|nr:hypothetical protein [Streptomyces viridochromogenes]KOG21800.1 hypothetical protein ADK36_12560 [Streptomyces viridochromogenes]